jgi:hypothetical protein
MARGRREVEVICRKIIILMLLEGHKPSCPYVELSPPIGGNKRENMEVLALIPPICANIP